MNRVLRRPMFRMGGSLGTGITSGLDRPGYRNGPGPNMLDVAGRSLPGNALTSNLTNKISSEAKRSRGIGLGTIPGFITSFGLNLAQSKRNFVRFASHELHYFEQFLMHPLTEQFALS